MQARGFDDILAKVNEMRTAFVLGQNALPFVEEVVVFMKRIAPLLLHVDARECATEGVPRGPEESSQNDPRADAENILVAAGQVLTMLESLRTTLESHVAKLECLASHNLNAQNATDAPPEHQPMEGGAASDAVSCNPPHSLLDLARETAREAECCRSISDEVVRIQAWLTTHTSDNDQRRDDLHLVKIVRDHVDRLALLLHAKAVDPDPARTSRSHLPDDMTATAPAEGADLMGGAYRKAHDGRKRRSQSDNRPVNHGDGFRNPAQQDSDPDSVFLLCRPPSQAEIDALFEDSAAR